MTSIGTYTDVSAGGGRRHIYVFAGVLVALYKLEKKLFVVWVKDHHDGGFQWLFLGKKMKLFYQACFQEQYSNDRAGVIKSNLICSLLVKFISHFISTVLENSDNWTDVIILE